MQPTLRTGTLGILMLTSVLLCAGPACTPPPATDRQEIVDTLRNAVDGAEVRRLDDGPQEYVSAVFRTFKAWQASGAALRGIAAADTFWAKDAPEWRDAPKVGERMKIVEAFLAETAPPAEPGKEPGKSPAQLAREFRDAVEKANTLSGIETSGLAADVMTVMAFEPAARKIGQVAVDYKALLALVSQHKEAFAPSTAGLTFTASEVTQQAQALHEKLAAGFAQDKKDELAALDNLLSESGGRKDREVFVEQKKVLAREGSTAELDVRRFRELDLKIKWFDARIKAGEAMKKRLDNAAK